LLYHILGLKITSKAGSLTAHQALQPRHVFRRKDFYNLPPPLGIHLVPRIQLIDTDECAISLQTSNRRFGKAYSGCLVSSTGNYCHEDKWTLILAIDSVNLKHPLFHKVAGTTITIFNAFIRGLLARLPPGIPRIFMWDNLKSHFSDELINEIYLAGHSIVPRPAYYPVDGPIEYIFNQIECGLKERMYYIMNETDLVREVYNIITNIQGLDETFAHCGY
jgi:hypothetical protein